MARLQEYLKYFVVQKISSDPLWQSVQVILSGHEVSASISTVSVVRGGGRRDILTCYLAVSTGHSVLL